MWGGVRVAGVGEEQWRMAWDRPEQSFSNCMRCYLVEEPGLLPLLHRDSVPGCARPQGTAHLGAELL